MKTLICEICGEPFVPEYDFAISGCCKKPECCDALLKKRLEALGESWYF